MLTLITWLRAYLQVFSTVKLPLLSDTLLFGMKSLCAAHTKEEGVVVFFLYNIHTYIYVYINAL